MRIYQRRSAQPLKWVLAFIIFLVALSVTFEDVYGFDGSSNTVTGKQLNQRDQGKVDPPHDITLDDPGDPGENFTPVSEPATWMLIAGGLSALYASRKMRKPRK